MPIRLINCIFNNKNKSHELGLFHGKLGLSHGKFNLQDKLVVNFI